VLRLTLGWSGPDALIQVVEVVEADLAHLGYPMLIGREVLADCRFIYDGRNGTYDLGF